MPRANPSRIELFQVPWSPFCIVQRRILEFAEAQFKSVAIPNTDRSKIWAVTRQRYYAVPVIRDGETVIFETSEDSQVIAKYLDQRFNLGLFPQQWRGLQSILWRHIENDIEGLTFKLNDIYWREFLPASEAVAFIRHKERKFGVGCLDKWKGAQQGMISELKDKLLPFEQMLSTRLFLLDDRPRFIDFDLYGMLANYSYTRHYQLPGDHGGIVSWFQRMSTITKSQSEKLRTRH